MKCINLLFVFITLLTACGEEQFSEYNSFFVQPGKAQKELLFDSIALEAIPIVLPELSHLGFSNLVNDRIYFADQHFARVYEFDKYIRLLQSHLGQGEGPKEIPIARIAGYAVSEKGYHYFIGTQRDLYRYDSGFNYLSRINFSLVKKGDNLFETEDFYAVDYENICFKVYRNNAYLNVTGGNKTYNLLNRDYYFNTRILMEVNLQDGKIERLAGRLGPEVKYMSAFHTYQYDMDEKGYFYLSFETDSLVYVYSQGYEIQYSFGSAGVGMDTNYQQLPEGEEYRKGYRFERENKGYYTSIKKVGDYLFRTYRTGGGSEADRLQIYRDKVLIADVEVPAQFRVMGYIEPYYYSHVIIEEIEEEFEELLTIYRFKIEEGEI